MAETNGKNKWIFWLAGILTTLILFITIPTMAANMIKNDKDSRSRDEKIDKASIERDDEIKDCIHIMQIEIVQRLTRMESKL